MCAKVLSLSIDFYVRVFVRVFTSPQTVKDSPTKVAYLYQSRGCDSFYMQSVGRKVSSRVGSSDPCVNVGPSEALVRCEYTHIMDPPTHLLQYDGITTWDPGRIGLSGRVLCQIMYCVLPFHSKVSNDLPARTIVLQHVTPYRL